MLYALLALVIRSQAPTCTTPPLAPVGASPHDLTRVIGGAHLGGDTALVMDAGEDLVYLVVPRARILTQWLRSGQGPAEYSRPRFIQALPGNQVALFSEGTRRLTVFDHAGKTRASHSLPNVPGYRLRGILGDTLLFLEGLTPLSLPPRMLGLNAGSRPLHTTKRDTVAVLRLTLPGDREDTLGVLQLPPRRTTLGSAFTSVPGFLDLYQPFGQRDDWAATTNGGVAIVRGTPYSVEWISATGKRLATTPLPAPDVPIRQAEKDDWWARSRHDSIIDLDCSVRPCRPTGVHKAAMPTDWPARKNPFDYQTLVPGPEGELWIRRAAPIDAAVTCYDVVQPTGRHRTVTFPAGRRVLIAAADWLFVLGQDEDDLQFVELYRDPR